MNEYDFIIVRNDGPQVSPADQPSPEGNLPEVPYEVARKMVKPPKGMTSWREQQAYYREHAHEVWTSPDGWTFYVLKKYQKPELEAKNPYARWFLLTTSPASPDGDMGDTYVRVVKASARRMR